MDVQLTAQAGRVKTSPLRPSSFPACLIVFFALFAIRVAAQPQPLVVTTVAGLANYGSADGIGSAAKFLLPTGVALDGVGNLYVADAKNDTIRKITDTGVVTTLAGAAQIAGTSDGVGSAARFDLPYGVAVDSVGNVFVADYNFSTIRKITTNGAVTTIAGQAGIYGAFNGIGTNSSFDGPIGIAIDGLSNIYVADSANNMIRKISNNVVTTLAGNLTAGTNDGMGTNAQFSSPYAVATDIAGNVYVADYGDNLIRRVTPAGVVTTIAGMGGTLFSSPSGIAVNSATNIYVADADNQIIRKITFNGTSWVVSILAGAGYSGDGDGIYPSATFSSPWGLTVDNSGNVYVGDSDNGNIRKITPSGVLSTFAGADESYGGTSANSSGFQARFFSPNGVAVDGATNLYVADTYNSCIREVTSAGTVTTLAGLEGETGHANGINNTSSFYYPTGLCIDAASNIYVADYYNSTVRKIMPTNGGSWNTTTIAGQVGVFSYLDAVGTNARFSAPYAVAVDNATNLYVADYYNNAIRKIAPGGNVSTYAGNPNHAAGYFDATGTNALFNGPIGIAVDSFTNVYVADSGNNVIRVIAPGGAVTTFAGSLAGVKGTNDGGSPLFNSPEGVAVDSLGNVYVADNGNNTIRGINPSGKTSSTIAGMAGFMGSADGLSAAAQFDAPIGVAVDSSGNIYVADALNNTIRKGTVYVAGQTAALTLGTSPSGIALGMNGTNYPATPQFLALAVGSTNTAMVTTTNTVTSTATNDYVFTNWTLNGNVVSTSSNDTVVLTTNETLVANFIPLYTLTVGVSSINTGTASGGGLYLAGSTNTVMVTASNGFTFSSWMLNGRVVSTSSNYAFTLGGNETLVANCLPAYLLSLSASPANGGAVGGDGSYLQGNTNTVTATASNGYAFVNWTMTNGAVASSNASYTFILNSNVTLVANFWPLYTLTVTNSPANGGAVGGGQTVISNTTVTATATTNSGYAFIDWTTTNGAFASSNASYSFALDSNETLVANFSPYYTLTMTNSPANGGAVGGGGTVVSNTTVTAMATTNSGFAFIDWTTPNGTFASSNASYVFALDSTETLVAHFSPYYTLTVTNSPAIGGGVSGGGTVVSNSTVTAMATTNSGYAFIDWTTTNGAFVSSNASYVFALDSTETLVAHFSPYYTLTLTNLPTNGGGVSGGGTVVSNTTVTATAAVNSGYTFIDWTTTNGVFASSNANYVFALDTNETLVANFLPTYTVSVITNPPNGGTVSGFGTFPSNTSVTVTATANPGFVLTNWTVMATNGSVTANSSAYTFTLSSNVTLAANFVTTPPQIGIFEALNGATNAIINTQTNVNFGSVQINQPGPIATFTVTNMGGQALVLTNITVSSNYTLYTNAPLTITNFPFTIAALSNATFSAQIITGNLGDFPGTIAITNNDPTNGTFSFGVTGTVVTPSPQIQVLDGISVIANGQTMVNFGSVLQNQTGSNVTFTVTNMGEQTLVLTNIAVPPGYTLLTTNFPTTIPPGSHGAFSVQLNGTVVAASGNIVITNNDPSNNPFIIPVTAQVTAKIISMSGSLAFGVVPIGSSANGTFTIKNSGNTNLTVNSINYGRSGFTGNWTGGQIAASNSQQVTVTFASMAAINYSSMVTVNSDATSGSNTLAISAFGANTSLVLTVLTNGTGTVTPNDAKLLKKGTKYSLKAVPGSGDVFAGWTGSFNVTNNPLSFNMATSTILQANFIPNPFLPFVGTYNGLFWADNGIVNEQTAGMLKGLTLTSKGTYSGSLLLNGATKSISGTFDTTGHTSKPITLGGQEGEVTLAMTLTSNNPAPQVTGTVSTANWMSTNLIAYRATNNNQIAPQYTLVIPPDTNSPSPPGGYGYASITGTVGTTRTPATAKIIGALADGTALSQSVSVSRDGYVPIYANLYSSKGFLLGWVNLDPTNTSGAALYWVHPAHGLFPSADSTNQIALSPWTNSSAIFGFLTNLTELDGVNGATVVTNVFVHISSAGRVSEPSVSVTITPKTGLFTVTIGSGASKVTGHGAILFNGTNGGGGYFVTKTSFGAVLFDP